MLWLPVACLASTDQLQGAPMAMEFEFFLMEGGLSVLIIMVTYVVYKVLKRTKIQRASTMNLTSGRREYFAAAMTGRSQQDKQADIA